MDLQPFWQSCVDISVVLFFLFFSFTSEISQLSKISFFIVCFDSVAGNNWLKCLNCLTDEEFISHPLLSSCDAFLSQADIEQFVFSRWRLQGTCDLRLHRIHHSCCHHWCTAGFQCGWLSVCLQRTLGKMCPAHIILLQT